jgi:excisionase family DNA binding protein
MTTESAPTGRSVEMPPLLIPVREVARLTSLSERTIWGMSAAGKMPAPLKLGSRRLWDREQLVKWIQCGCSST